jgi:tetratricopeptide (TPR) repeat protein
MQEGNINPVSAAVGVADSVKPAYSMVEKWDRLWPNLLSAMAILCVGAVFYFNSFQGVFLYDDADSIIGNVGIRHVWPIWTSMFAPINATRPLVGLTNAINYAISGVNPWSYHAVNLLVHIAAALALFGIVRRTLSGDALRQRFGKDSAALALVVSLIWMVHPLQTEAVTYVIQRCESLMGMFYFLVLYCSLRSFDSRRKALWYAAAIGACAAGMMSKQVMVTAPLVVLLYDFMFASGSLKGALRRRWVLYAGLAATWGILVATMIAAPPSETAGFGVRSISSWDYCKSEFGVLVYYVRLCLWPTNLCFDYGWPTARKAADIVPHAVIVAGVVLATSRAIMRRKPAGFLGAWFFLIILPTSSVVPIQDLINEHRMYLPLASIVAFVVLTGYSLGERLVNRAPAQVQFGAGIQKRVYLALATVVVVILGLCTTRRNIDYASEIVMWTDVVAKRPDNPRGHNNLGKMLLDRGRIEEAITQFTKALELSPNYAYAHYNLGAALLSEGNVDAAKPHIIEAVRLNPRDAKAHYNLGAILGVQGQIDGAIQEFALTLQIKPDFVEAYQQLGFALEVEGRVAEAKEQYRIALHLRPDWRELEEHVAALQ